MRTMQRYEDLVILRGLLKYRQHRRQGVRPADGSSTAVEGHSKNETARAEEAALLHRRNHAKDHAPPDEETGGGLLTFNSDVNATRGHVHEAHDAHSHSHDDDDEDDDHRSWTRCDGEEIECREKLIDDGDDGSNDSTADSLEVASQVGRASSWPVCWLLSTQAATCCICAVLLLFCTTGIVLLASSSSRAAKNGEMGVTPSSSPPQPIPQVRSPGDLKVASSSSKNGNV